MRIAIMQPYLFPYLGYFQLINAVDAFVFLDDAAFIKKGWINRNKLELNGQETWFTVPLEKISQNRTIRDTQLCPQGFESWKRKFRQSLRHFYSKAPYFAFGESLLEDVLAVKETSIAALAIASVERCCRLLGITMKFVLASVSYPQGELRKEARLTDICKKAGAEEYVNAPGGVGIYSKEQFASQGLQLRFLQPEKIAYRTRDGEHGLNFSILDALMWCGPEQISADLLHRYELC